MKAKNTRGGRREGSGRKKVADKKKQLSISLRESVIKSLGGDDKAKEILHNHATKLVS